MKYRRKVEVVADLLSAAREGAKKTHIMYGGKLSFKYLNVYLRLVTKAGLVSLDEHTGRYSITEKGKVFLTRFKKYKRRVDRLEKQHGLVKNEMTFLEKMCFSVSLSHGGGSDGKVGCNESNVESG